MILAGNSALTGERRKIYIIFVGKSDRDHFGNW
jgi:hypothetical protein